MRRFLLIPALLATVAGANAQVLISNAANAITGFGTDGHSQSITSAAQWDGQGRISDVNGNAPIHPFDPPSNNSEAWSKYTEAVYGVGIYKSYAIAMSDYRGLGGNDIYQASTTFSTDYQLTVSTGGNPLGSYHVSLVMPAHGILGARGKADYPGSSIARADFAISVTGNALSSSKVGSVIVDSPEDGVQSATGTGEFAGAVGALTYSLETPVDTRTVTAYELADFVVLDLGFMAGATNTNFSIHQSISTSVIVDGSDSVYAIADFRNTSGYGLQMTDTNGDPYNGFSVTPVPEPTSMLVLGLGVVALLRKKQCAND